MGIPELYESEIERIIGNLKVSGKKSVSKKEVKERLLIYKLRILSMNKEELKKLEATLWQTADTLRANSDLKSSEYSTPVLGLIFLRFADNKYSRYETAVSEGVNYDKFCELSDSFSVEVNLLSNAIGDKDELLQKYIKVQELCVDTKKSMG